MTEENKICGFTREEIRKQYFGGKLKKLLADILASGVATEEEIKKLEAYLEEIKTEGDKMVKNIIDTFGGKEIETPPPTSTELMEGVKWTAEEEKKALEVVNYIETELNNLRHAVATKKPIPNTYWLDMSVKFLSFELLLSRYYVYKAQLYNARIADIIDNAECSRAEAENRAKMTKEYSDYKMLQRIIGDQNLTGILERFENLSKKYDAKN